MRLRLNSGCSCRKHFTSIIFKSDNVIKCHFFLWTHKRLQDWSLIITSNPKSPGNKIETQHLLCVGFMCFTTVLSLYIGSFTWDEASECQWWCLESGVPKRRKKSSAGVQEHNNCDQLKGHDSLYVLSTFIYMEWSIWMHCKSKICDNFNCSHVIASLIWHVVWWIYKIWWPTLLPKHWVN